VLGKNHHNNYVGLGSTMELSNENGFVVHSYFYDDFGNSLGGWGSVSNSYLYTGQEYDDEISIEGRSPALFYERAGC